MKVLYCLAASVLLLLSNKPVAAMSLKKNVFNRRVATFTLSNEVHRALKTKKPTSNLDKEVPFEPTPPSTKKCSKLLPYPPLSSSLGMMDE